MLLSGMQQPCNHVVDEQLVSTFRRYAFPIWTGIGIHAHRAPDQKSKRKKKPKKKPAAQVAATDVPATPTETNETHNGLDEDEDADHEDPEIEESLPSPVKEDAPGQRPPVEESAVVTNGVKDLTLEPDENDSAARFDALVKDRDALRQEVTQLRQSLEQLQAKHTSEVEAVQTELADTQAEKENAEEQYQSLLGKVNTIRSQLGERLKADAVGPHTAVL